MINYAFGNFLNVARTSVHLHPMLTEVRTTTATAEFLNIKLRFFHRVSLLSATY